MKFPFLGVAACSALTVFTACNNNAQKDTATHSGDTTSGDTTSGAALQPMPPAADDSLFTKDESGLNYRWITHGTGAKTPAEGEVAMIHLTVKIGDSVVVNTDQQNGNMAVPQIIATPSMKGDLMGGIAKMKAGDSAVFRMPADTFFARAHQPKMPFVRPGANIEFAVKLDEITTKDAVETKMEAQRMKASKAQNEADDNILQEYFRTHNIRNLKKTATGIYYTVTKPGSGPHPAKGQTATVNYTGQNLKGEKFDSNVDPAFNHVGPFDFTIGGNVIAGWNQAVPLMNKGMKATFYIPSSLAYGPQGQGGKIGPNEILAFDIELVDFK